MDDHEASQLIVVLWKTSFVKIVIKGFLSVYDTFSKYATCEHKVQGNFSK